MKKGFAVPLAVLVVTLAFCLWNSAAMTSCAARWQAQLEEAERRAESGDWKGAVSALQDGYADWAEWQDWLHCVTGHDAVDGAEAMYHRAAAFAESEEDSEFRAELAELRETLLRLAEMEEFSLRNIL